MKTLTIDQWLRENLANSIVIQARDNGEITALLFEGTDRQNTLPGDTTAETIVQSEDWLTWTRSAPEPTIPVNELPESDSALDTLRPAEVANV